MVFGKGEGIVKYDIWIFNHLGTLLFHGNDLNDKWDDKAIGSQEIVQQGVYIWKVQLTDIFNKKHDYLGTVTLVK